MTWLLQWRHYSRPATAAESRVGALVYSENTVVVVDVASDTASCIYLWACFVSFTLRIVVIMYSFRYALQTPLLISVIVSWSVASNLWNVVLSVFTSFLSVDWCLHDLACPPSSCGAHWGKGLSQSFKALFLRSRTKSRLPTSRLTTAVSICNPWVWDWLSIYTRCICRLLW